MKNKTKPSYVKALLAKLSVNKQLEKIVNDGMCIGCGLCQSYAGRENIAMSVFEDGSLAPKLTGYPDNAIMSGIVDICPGTRVSGLPESELDAETRYDEMWGFWRDMSLAWSADADLRFKGSTGGLLTALAMYLVESDEVDFILHAHASTDNPTFGEAWISHDRQDVVEAMGSRYGPTATLEDIVQLLEHCEQNDERFAFIGTPCDVNGLRNLAETDPRVRRYCCYQLVMVCGGFMQPSGFDNAMRRFGIAPEKVSSVRYRGYGCPGPTRIETEDGQIVEKNYVDFWGEDDTGWDLPLRCKVCPDGIGDAADIAVSDTWNGGAPAKQGQEHDPGVNAAVIRSPAGEALFNRAVAVGFVEQGETITPRDMDRFQPHQVAKKHAVWSRFVGMRSVGSVVPDVSRLRLKPLARRNTVSDNLAEAHGAKRRARAKRKQ